jgi:hypothetical protein
MDQILDEKLQNMEVALNAVIDSTKEYNPSPADAERLLESDGELDAAVATRRFILECTNYKIRN